MQIPLFPLLPLFPPVLLALLVVASVGTAPGASVPAATDAAGARAEHCVITDPIIVGGNEVFPSGKYCVPV